MSMFRKNQKFPLFPTKTAENMKEILSNECCSIDSCKNISISKLSVKKGIKNTALALWKNPPWPSEKIQK